MARDVVNRQINIWISSGEAQKAYDVLIKKEKELNAELAKTSDPKRMAALKGELDKLREPMDRLKKKVSGELTPTFRDLEAGVRKFLNEFKKTGSPEALANFKKFQAELNKMKDEINGLENSQKGFGKSGFFSAAFWGNLAAGAVTGFFSQLSGFFTSSVDEALQADSATIRLKSTLDNLGRSDSFDRIVKKADELAQKFRYLDNDDILGVFKKLIDYGKLTEQQMNDLLPVIIDFAANSQISIDESASVIIKALEGNGKGLKEYGINIKDAKTETERFSIVMDTLKGKVDGAGEAFQNSAAGGIATARQELNNLKEDIGNLVIPALNKLLSFVVGALKGLKQFAKDVRNAFTGATDGSLQQEANQQSANSLNENFLKTLGDKNNEERQKLISAEISFLNAELNKNTALLGPATEKLKNFKDQLERGDSKLTKSNLEYLNRIGTEAEELDNHNEVLKQRILLLKDELSITIDTKKLGLDQDEKDKDKAAKDKEIAKTLADEQKRALEERKKLLEELNKIQFDQSLVGIPQLDKEMKLMDKKYAELRVRAKGETEILIRIQQLYLTERIQLIDSYAEREVEAWKRVNEKTMSEQDKQIANNLKRLRDQADKVLNGENDGSIKRQTALTEQQQKEDKDAKLQKIKEYIGYASQVSDILSSIGQAQTDRENAELERDRILNERKIRALDARLKKGIISQQQYDREVQLIERNQEKREKEIRRRQFERQKRQQLLQAVINTAEAVTEALPNILLAAIVGAAGAIQIGLIASQKPPEYARGGQLGGSSHAEGGNPILDGKTGRKIAEIEKGEGIINKRSMADGNVYTVTGTPSQIASGINGIAGGVQWNRGARLMPAWYSRQPVPMNFAAINRYFAAGGKFGTDPGNNTGGNNDQVMQMLVVTMDNMQMTIARMQTTLENGIYAYSLVTENEKAQERLNNIRSEATIKG